MADDASDKANNDVEPDGDIKSPQLLNVKCKHTAERSENYSAYSAFDGLVRADRRAELMLAKNRAYHIGGVIRHTRTCEAAEQRHARIVCSSEADRAQTKQHRKRIDHDAKRSNEIQGGALGIQYSLYHQGKEDKNRKQQKP